ncbi:biotin/lipoyl-binding protein [Burkholderia sp. Bp9143]|uniref:acetyl-CoA carboxylase biotin carboxyl carrier protein n=1 Tax=Burkholderia sp. Bp9143 TaxID=2184574 RepID=UPI000F5940C7|nr:acetyl-CoA carboxylase biotin carboxyl carrier protein subunit [Burkholderia sp. Bp9143]RQR32742.1 biotin/lipoyl-binding protein [Burkholderia sp. Bp9143]
MDLKKIKSLIDLLAESPLLVELELLEGDDKVKLVKRHRRDADAAPATAADAVRARAPQPRAAAGQEAEKPSAASPAARPDAAPRVVRAPMFGIAHLQPSPGDPLFVAVDDAVKAGQVLCTIEAMKVFHAIESEYDGRVAEVLVKSGEEIEAGQPLFRIE